MATGVVALPIMGTHLKLENPSKYSVDELPSWSRPIRCPSSCAVVFPW